MTRIKPFGKGHVIFDDPLSAIKFYEENAQREDRLIPDSIRDLLLQVAHYDPEAKWSVQPGYATNFITVARATDRRPWLFAKPEGVSIWVGSDRNAEALCDFWPDLTEEPPRDNKSLPFVLVSPEKVGDGALCAVMFAAAHALKEAGDTRNP